MKRYPIFLLLAFFFSVPATAGVNNLLYEHRFDECNLTISHDVADSFDGVIVIRSLTKDYGYCAVSKQQVALSLAYAMKALVGNSNLKEVSSVFIGRLRSYKWMGDFLIRQSKISADWDSDLGKPLAGSNSTYVNAMLNVAEMLFPFSVPLQKHGYELTGVECEKIMVNNDKLPYEALCWLKIRHKI